jgi:aldehyde:ferredoxin oxidoreductase
MNLNAEVSAMQAKHKVVNSIEYEPGKIDKGYTMKYLRVDIGTGDIAIRDITQEMIDIFIGGKGFDLRLMWDEVTPQTKWDDPTNAICISSGPLGGTTSFSGAGKSLVTSISPTTGAPIDSNVGGHFGPFLKFCGFDALVVVGKSDEERILVLDGANKKISIESAPEEAVDAHVVAEQLTEMYSSSPNDRDNVSVVSAGRGAEHALIGCLNFSWFDWRRGGTRLKQAGRGGIGSVFRSKKIKALVAHPAPWRPKWKVTIGGNG